MLIRTASPAQTADLTYSLFREVFPWVTREEKTARAILSDPANTVFLAEYGAAVLHKNNVLLLAVPEPYRGRGIGSALLNACENAARAAGYPDITVGAGDDYLTPGVPCRTRPYEEPLMPDEMLSEIDDTARAFFEKRGYTHSWGACNCFDMSTRLPSSADIPESVGDAIDGITYTWATPAHRDGILRVTDAAEESFTKYYAAPPSPGTDVIVALSGGTPVGVIMVSRGTEAPDTGSVGCTAVRPDFQNRGIATRMVRMGAKSLAESGYKKGFLGYTYSGLDKMYGRAGYHICAYYFMAKKKL